jgi:hypothetical protein
MEFTSDEGINAFKSLVLRFDIDPDLIPVQRSPEQE